MGKLYITSKNPDLKPGEVHTGMTGPWKYGFLPSQTYRIVGPAKEEDWVNCHVEWGGPRDHFESITKINGPWYYYEIETD